MGMSDDEARKGEPMSSSGYEVPEDIQISVLHEAIYNGVRGMMASHDYDSSDLPISIKDHNSRVFTIEFPLGSDYEIIVRKKAIN